MPIRQATPDDVAALLPLFRAYCDFYEMNPPDAGLKGMIEGAIAEPVDRAFVLVAEEDDGIAGFANCWWKWSSLRGGRAVFLDDLFVRPESRGKGHADALIEGIAQIGREHGAIVVTWLTQHSNKRAQAVYNRIGGQSEEFLEYELTL